MLEMLVQLQSLRHSNITQLSTHFIWNVSIWRHFFFVSRNAPLDLLLSGHRLHGWKCWSSCSEWSIESQHNTHRPLSWLFHFIHSQVSVISKAFVSTAGNNIADPGMYALCDALKVNTSLKQLELCGETKTLTWIFLTNIHESCVGNRRELEHESKRLSRCNTTNSCTNTTKLVSQHQTNVTPPSHVSFSRQNKKNHKNQSTLWWNVKFVHEERVWVLWKKWRIMWGQYSNPPRAERHDHAALSFSPLFATLTWKKQV